MIPKSNRIFMAIIGLLILILTLGYFLFGDDSNDDIEIEESGQSREMPEAPHVPYPPIQLIKPKEIKDS